MIKSLISQYLVLITPFAALAIAQLIKVFTRHRTYNKLTLKKFLNYFFSYAGMPSGHTAFISSLVAAIALREGLSSTIFAFVFVFAMIVVNDALRLRRFLGQQGEVLNDLVGDLKEDDYLDKRYPKLLEKIGHTVMEVLAGALLGISLALILYLIFGR